MFPALYAILDADLVPHPPERLADALVSAGVGLIQYRAKQAPGRSLFEACRALVARYRAQTVRIIVNDRPDVAALCAAGGVHVGQEDLPVAGARRVCGPAAWVGVSTHSVEQFREAAETSADYIAVGPVFATSTKANPDPVVGLELLRRVRALTSKPIVAIGGITLENAADVFRAGADSVAVARGLFAGEAVAERARDFLELAWRARPPGN